ncbi:MAG: response regulator [Candidatus Omnitrophica bacterium]|nr:response regulator [Candidatus Omnitrophota bacterium]
MDKKKTVLLLENEQELSGYLKKFIPLLGDYQVEEASDDVEILAKVNAFEPELVIFDCDTPKVHGKTVLKEILKSHPKTKVLAIATAKSDKDALREEGIHDVIAKTFDLGELSRKLKSLLPLSETRAEKKEGARLLLADDEPGVNEFLESLFKPLGIEVYGAANGEEALRLFKEKRCNLAIIDLRIPRISGFELIKLLEKSVDPPKPKSIIIITAALGEAQTELGRLDHPLLLKPLDPDLLEEMILEICKKNALTLSV